MNTNGWNLDRITVLVAATFSGPTPTEDSAAALGLRMIATVSRDGRTRRIDVTGYIERSGPSHGRIESNSYVEQLSITPEAIDRAIAVADAAGTDSLF